MEDANPASFTEVTETFASTAERGGLTAAPVRGWQPTSGRQTPAISRARKGLSANTEKP